MAKLKAKMGNVVIVARRWFNRGPGNTYHSVEIVLDGKHIHKVDYAYGYGQQYEWTAAEWLEANGWMPGREHSKHGGPNESLWRYCERMGISYAHSVADVPRKKDL